MEKTRPIGVFDSGVGGLTVAQALMRELPREHIVYVGDTARYPYGNRSEETIRRMAEECIEYLLSHEVKLVVVACNTATAFAFEHLKARFPAVPFVGVVAPCVEAVVRGVAEGAVGVIGTEGTISCGIYERSIKARNPALAVYSRACPLLVPLAEEGVVHGPIVELVLDMYLKEFVPRGLKALILGCTHYPFFKQGISAYFQGKVDVFDSATWTARATAAELERRGLCAEREPVSVLDHRFVVTDHPIKFRKTGEAFLGQAISKVMKVTI
ncbi:MAG: glutamate racemase [Candidatus Raymondbacteria bacterium RifOxyA12_full_50_37]|uniref:Glutamate racemase n=1 Tax=Candidatus Raymondbacteria bacterium RIFOXYD12_FULL_49_13 TaxID=1817890 RepID=A0A1F7F5T9_UNCRA|nr:MAG: glutamate racemase [Candidatus Raymondbacteria bacterium RifOxyA12_full_50_37]OGJ89158.1 MAG: glutamate racemase [Candidatus Raymondbacteria bacterium RIFOXYA2_FULL_49_16]OGJ96640.1 MAG: glutamate racemase [Candidatus Raymondbacteria bacterium RIFOXYC2_FULL_50_21]OGK01952.1 MAG: glutamate racemase [Candidatus Raymondbacteria bacterium RIFOXYD12_FULL_49_13]OGP42200.1 MAG: glutamate racemase [Candidatus Raymondbacteria bacterium RIFOXYB2_FULL_49_35]